MIKIGCLAISVFLILVLTMLGNAESPYSVDFDLRNMDGFDDNAITAEDIVAYIQENYSNSPLLIEDDIGDCFISAGQNNNVNPAFLVATAELEGRFGTAGWATNNLDCHNTMGYDISDSGPGQWSCVDSWCAMISRVASVIAIGDNCYTQSRFTVNQVREKYATNPNSEAIAQYMNELYTFSINRKTGGLDVPAADVSYSPSDSSQQASSEISASTKSPRIAWRKVLEAAGYVTARSVRQTTDGGYIIAGMGATSGDYDAWLIKTDSDGNVLWNKNFGGPEESETQNTVDDVSTIQQTSDGGYIIFGNTWTINGNRDAWLIRTDSNGNKLWDKAIEGTGYEYFSSGQQTEDDGYIIVGTTRASEIAYPDLWIAKTDSNGNKIWESIFKDPNGVCSSAHSWQGMKPSIQQTNDGGYIILSFYETCASPKAWLIKTDVHGNELWNKTLTADNEYNEYRFVQQTSDGGYIIAGANVTCTDTYIDTCTGHAYMAKTDSSGNKKWDKTFGNRTVASIVRQTSDGGYILAGENHENPYTTTPVYVLKTDSSGNKVWDKTFGASSQDTPVSVQQTSDGGYIIVGFPGVWLAKIDGNTGSVIKANNPNLLADAQKQDENTNTEAIPINAKDSPLPILIGAISLIAAILFMKSKRDWL